MVVFLYDLFWIVEEWFVVDNFLLGCVDFVFVLGWNVRDFVFFLKEYEDCYFVVYLRI